MTICIGTTFPRGWQYGPDEIAIVGSTKQQIDRQFPHEKNLLINTTWFGPQFNNSEWPKVQNLTSQGKEFDNLFLLAVIDPQYLMDQDLEIIQRCLKIKNTYRIGMYANSEFEWNFHAFTVAQHCVQYSDEDLIPVELDRAFLLYQRKPRPHRIELTRRLIDANILDRGIVTLGSNQDSNYDWTEGQAIPKVLTLDDNPANYKHNGKHTEFGGIPNDLVSIGRLDIWRRCLVNVVSETEFDNHKPRFVTEKMWKPILGLRPFLIHGQTQTYQWLRNHGFKTFNHIWQHIDVEGSPDVHGSTVEVLKWLSQKSSQQLMSIFEQILPDLRHNQNRYYQFAQEQKYKMSHLWS